MKTPSEIPYWFCNEDQLADSDIDNQIYGRFEFTPEVSLFKLKSGDFHVTQIGEFKAILSGANYILVKRDVAKYLYELLPNDIEVRDVTIHRKVTEEKWSTYSEIVIKNEIQFEGYYDLHLTGLHAYKMFNSLLFVTSEVKSRITEHFGNLPGATFKRGLPFMGGGKNVVST